MCKKAKTTDSIENLKTSYQRAHYFENVIDDKKPNKCSQNKSKIRPDLYVYDPIINEKRSTYEKHYGATKSSQRSPEHYGKYNFVSKSSYKNIYNDFHSKPIGTLKHDVTSSGVFYDDPRKAVETKLEDDFNREISRKEESSSCHDNYFEFVYPYISTTKSHFQNLTKSLVNGITRGDAKCRVQDKNIPEKKFYYIEPKFFFKVPFHGDSSVYRESYRDPAKKDAFLSKVCLFPDYFESVKLEVSKIPKMYLTEQKKIGSGLRD